MGKQALKLKLQTKLSPQQLTLMRLLQLPVMALQQSILEEVEKNPLLEAENISDEWNRTESLDANVEENESDEFFGNDDDSFFNEGLRTSRHDSSDNDDWRTVASRSMADDLFNQLAIKDISQRELTIVTELVGNLDDAGYLSRDLDLIENELAFREGLECNDSEMQHALDTLQSLEPAGIGARSLQECLMLQTKRHAPRTFASRCAEEVIGQCFELLGQHNYEAIKERIGIDDEALADAIEFIQKLNPKPYSEESTNVATTIIPDFVVSISDGRLTCQVNTSNTPTLKTNSYYDKMLADMQAREKRTAAEQETLDYLKEHSESAKEFIECIDLRKSNLLNAMTFLAKYQRKFFATGDPADLRPLTQKELAEKLDMDESVMSRIVNQKYVQTDFGTILMKDLFVHSTTNNAEGEDVTTAMVKKHLKELVDSEDKTSPLTDAQLEQLMAQRGFTLARRTIAKYRDALGIPVGRVRKMLKSVMLIVMLATSTLMAQQPKSYFDSLIMMQQQTPSAAKTPEKSPSGKTRIKQNTAALDTALLRGDDLVKKQYSSERPMPSSMWYGNKFSSQRVRLESYTLDSLPDEVNLKLLKGDEQFCFPVKNVRTSPYGWRWERPHRGVDIALNTGDEVHCAFDGVVRIAKPMGAYGNLVVVRHFNGLETVYGHLSKIKVQPMQEVKAGAVLGLGGSTGRSTGPHLHFEVRFQYEPFDPEWILDFSNYTLRTKKLHLDKTYFGISKPKGHRDLAYKADKSFVKESTERVKPKELYYTVKKGDHMKDILSLYKITEEKLIELNPEFERLKPGLKLRVR